MQNGGTLLSGVSKNLNYLIAGEKAGSKLEKAKKLEVKVICKGSEAISFVLVDDKVSSEVVKKISNLEDIIEAKYIRIYACF